MLYAEIANETFVPYSTRSSLFYKKFDGEEVHISGFRQLQHALDGQEDSKPLKVRVVAECSKLAAYTIMHGKSFLLIPISPQHHFSYEKLQARVRSHFGIPSSCKFEFVHMDPKHPAEQHTTIVNDFELRLVKQQTWMKDKTKDTLHLATKVI